MDSYPALTQRTQSVIAILSRFVSRCWLRRVVELTLPACSTARPVERASHATMVAISWIRDFVSLALVEAERRRLSLALTQGCVETWTLVAMLWVQMLSRAVIDYDAVHCKVQKMTSRSRG